MKRSPLSRRRAARLAAVQALYQIELGNLEPEPVVREFRVHRLPGLLENLVPGTPAVEVDRDWFEKLVLGTWRAHEEIDAHIAAALSPGWSLERCGYLLRACLRAGVFELLFCPDVPPAVVIDEYIELAQLFFSGEEPAFVHAVLDRVRRDARTASQSAGR